MTSISLHVVILAGLTLPSKTKLQASNDTLNPILDVRIEKRSLVDG